MLNHQIERAQLNSKASFTLRGHLQNTRRRKLSHIRRMQTRNRTLLLLNRRSGMLLKIQRQFRNIRPARVRYKHQPTSHDEPPSHSTRYPNNHGKQKCSNYREFSLSTNYKYFHTYSDTLLSGGILLVSMVLIAPLIRGHLFLHRVDVFAAALPGGLSAYLAGGGSTHDCLLPCCAANSSANPRHGVSNFRPSQAGYAIA